MDFTLKDNTAITLQEEIENDITDITKLNLDIENINSAIDTVKADIASIEDKVADNKSKTTALVAAVDACAIKASDTDKTVANLNKQFTTKKLIAESSSIQEAAISKANVTELTVTNPIESDIENASIKTSNLDASTITSDKASVAELDCSSLTVNGSLDINQVDADNINATDVVSTSINTDDITVNNKIIFNGIEIKSIDIKASGIDNMHLHKLTAKVDGVLIIKLPDSSIIVNASDVKSNYDGLYASYIENGNTVLYISQDIDCQALVIGSASIKASTVLKTSVRRNADSNGNPNIENTVKVAVVDKLPVIGQRNVIYVVLGDCAYYCDGQYFYEMAAKKKS